MTSPFTAIEPLLASSKRVLRNKTSVQDLIAVYPSLKQKCLTSPSTLTDSERRLLLDLPDVEMETTNISAVTSIQRTQLIEKAISDRASLSQEEVVLLKDHFWTPSTGEENSRYFHSLAKVSDEALEEFEAARQPAYSPNEQEAFSIGVKEFWSRAQALHDDEMRVAAEAALPDAQEWIRYLYQQQKQHWGFICLYDAAAQKLDPRRLDDFRAHLSGFFRDVLRYTGSEDIIDHKWRLMSFNSPNSAFAPRVTPISDDSSDSAVNFQDGAVFRKAFQEILKDPQEYQRSANVTAVNTPTHQFKDGIAASGILTNTFLVINLACINSVLASGHWYDDMRMLAFEAEFPVEGRTYAEGYQGYTWVRLDQLVYNFYELRLMKADEVGMDDIWKAAQKSSNGAFVSIDAEAASSWTPSRSMSGFTRDSILGKRWYAVRDARKE